MTLARCVPTGRVIALLLWLAVAVACERGEQTSPEEALTAWVGAMNAARSDIAARQRAFEMLSTPAREALAERAARASQLSGRELHAWEMLAPGRFTPRFGFDPEGLSAQVRGNRAVVTARGRGGERAEVPMVREGGRWRVDLALPAMQPIRTEGFPLP